MAEQLADKSSEDRAARTAELKRKMQEAAQRNKPAASATDAPAEAVSAQVAPAPIKAVPAPPPAFEPAPAPAAPLNGEPVVTPAPSVAVSVVSGNGASPHAVVESPVVAAAPEDPAARARREMNRREFLTYAWGAALGLVLLEAGYATFDFMYPRFKAGEFGGKFFLGPMSSMPPTDAPPQPHVDGKFWLVNTTDEGVRALYMVCTHLGCLYKWEPSTVRFECPCHGSKFSREGYYIEGPAPRSLDTFLVSEDAGVVVVDTGKKTQGAPSSESPAKAV